MPTRVFEAGVLFGVAVEAAHSIKASPRTGGQRPALVSIVFSVVSLEAFFNEITEAAHDSLKYPPNLEPQEVSVFAQVMTDAESSRASLEAKFTFANWILARKQLDRGAQPYQDFALLMRLRNDLVHFKAGDAFELDQTPEEIHKNLISRFKHKNILADDMQQMIVPWTYIIETKALAEWSCRTAASMVSEFCVGVPHTGVFKHTLEMVQRNFESQVASFP